MEEQVNLFNQITALRNKLIYLFIQITVYTTKIIFIINFKFINRFCMGGVCWPQATLHQNVHKLPNQVPYGQQYIMKQSHSIRFPQVTVNRINSTMNSANNNQYKFIMKISVSSMPTDSISVNLIILNQNIQKLLADNYQLRIQKKMIIDIFNKKLSTTLVEATNQKSGAKFSVQVCSFHGYTSEDFKRSLYLFYLLKKRVAQIQNNHLYYHKLVDHFVYGCNPDKQALTLLFQRAQTSLANIAEYRKIAQWPWTTDQKLKIFIDIMNGVYYLHKKRIFHRDIRPSNIFYIQRLGRYVIGSFAKSIQILEDPLEQHNRTVYGIQYMYRQGCDYQNVKKVGDYLKNDKQLAPYVPRNMDYHGLSVILHALQTMDVINLRSNYNDKVINQVHKQLNQIYDQKNQRFDQVRQRILKLTQKYGIEHVKLAQDSEISTLVHRLASVTHRQTIQSYMFQVYDTLGYENQFSNTTHQLIQKNNEQKKSLQNAYLLKNLGQFFDRNGAKGTQYYCNACLLFLKRTQKQINYQKIQSGKKDFSQAQKCYIKFSQNFQSHSTYIQLHRIKALLKMHQNQLRQAMSIIQQIFVFAAKKKISIQKQMTLLVTYAKIYLQGNTADRYIGEQKLKNGLAICQNKGAFQNIISCNIHTSNFLFQLGVFYYSKIRQIQFFQLKKKFKVTEIMTQSMFKVDPKMQVISGQFLLKYKALTESNLKSCLDIRQKSSVDPIDIVNVLRKLGSFYYDVQLFVEAKQTFKRCIARLQQIWKQVSPTIIIQTLYSYGSTLYSLNQFGDAENQYQKALDVIQKPHYFQSNSLLKHSIQGNLGLAKYQMNKSGSEKIILQAMNKIKQLQSDKFYDYVFLKAKYDQLKQKKKKTR